MPLFSLLISAYLFAYATVRLDYPTSEEAPIPAHWSDSPEKWFWYLAKGPWAQHFLPVGSAKSIVETFEAGPVTLGTYCTSGTDQHSGGYADACDSSAASIPGHHGADIPTALPPVPLPSLACNRGRRSGGGRTGDRILARQRGDSSGHTYCRVLRGGRRLRFGWAGL